MSESRMALIVEDEEHIGELIRTNLQIEGYETIWTDSAYEALQIAKQRSLDLIVLDVMLPDGSGIDICRKIKMIRNDIPILMLSALGQSADRIKGLKAGADDYLPKPFDLEELLLRVHNLADRYSAEIFTSTSNLTLGQATINFDDMTISRGEDTHALTNQSALLLKYIVEHRGEVISRQSIYDEVWGFDHYPNSRTMDNFITTFRKYIEETPSDPQIITTVRGIGYRIN